MNHSPRPNPAPLRAAATSVVANSMKPWAHIRAWVTGDTEYLPDVQDKGGLNLWGHGDLPAHFPYPDVTGGCVQDGMYLTDIARHPDTQAAFEAAGITPAILESMATDARNNTPISGALAEDNRYDPDTNPEGFPHRYDRTLTCKDFLLLRQGTDDGCQLSCMTYVTKNGDSKGIVRLACGDETCKGYRSMVSDDKDKGPTAMLTANRILIKKVGECLRRTQDVAYPDRLKKYLNVLLAHKTLVLGWLRYEARRAQHKEEVRLRQGGMAGTRNQPQQGKGRGRGKGKGSEQVTPKGKGRGKGTGRGRGSDRSQSQSIAPSSSPTHRTPMGHRTPMSTTSRDRGSDRGSDHGSNYEQFMAWSQHRRANAHREERGNRRENQYY